MSNAKDSWNLEDLNLFSENIRSFVSLELNDKFNKQFYRERIEKLNLKKGGIVLDAGCGLGQWSIILSEYFEYVIGIDLSDEYINFAKHLSKVNNVYNSAFYNKSIENTGFEDEYFSNIICYSVIYYTDYQKTLNEFWRILKRGGRVYISTDSTGWYLKKALDGLLKKKSLNIFTHELKRILRKYFNEKKNRTFDVLITENFLRKIIKHSNFEIISMTTEGKINNSYNSLAKYKSKYLGFPLVLDVLLEKK